MFVYTGAADIIVTRAGGNAMAEFGTQGKPCIVIPNPDLTGGHQLKNAALLAEQGAARVIAEADLYDSQQGLLSAISSLLADTDARAQLASRLQAITIQGAAHKLAELLVSQGEHKK